MQSALQLAALHQESMPQAFPAALLACCTSLYCNACQQCSKAAWLALRCSILATNEPSQGRGRVGAEPGGGLGAGAGAGPEPGGGPGGGPGEGVEAGGYDTPCWTSYWKGPVHFVVLRGGSGQLEPCSSLPVLWHLLESQQIGRIGEQGGQARLPEKAQRQLRTLDDAALLLQVRSFELVQLLCLSVMFQTSVGLHAVWQEHTAGRSACKE